MTAVPRSVARVCKTGFDLAPGCTGNGNIPQSCQIVSTEGAPRCVHAVASEPGPISRRCGRRDSPETGPGSGSGATVRARNRCHESQIETAGISADSVPIGLHFGPSPKLSPWPLSWSNFRVDLAARYINFAVFYNKMHITIWWSLKQRMEYQSSNRIRIFSI